MIRELEISQIEQVAGGDEMTNGWGQMVGAIFSECKEHPEVALVAAISPLAGAIYLATRH